MTNALYYTSATPSSANYTVEADVHVASAVENDMAGVVGRLDTTSGTYYLARYQTSQQRWILYAVVNGTWNWLGASTVQPLAPGTSHRLSLVMSGTSVRVLVNGDQQISVDKTAISADGAGTNAGAATGGITLGAAGAPHGEANTAATFDGIDDAVLVPDAPALKPVTVSVEAWVRPSAGMPSFASVATKTTASTRTDGYGMHVLNGGIAFWVNSGANRAVTAALPAGTWSHVVGTYDGSTVRIYRNGVLAQSFAHSTPLTHSSSPLLIGNAAGGSFHWAGDLDEVALYSRALTATEVAEHYGAGQ